MSGYLYASFWGNAALENHKGGGESKGYGTPAMELVWRTYSHVIVWEVSPPSIHDTEIVGHGAVYQASRSYLVLAANMPNSRITSGLSHISPTRRWSLTASTELMRRIHTIVETIYQVSSNGCFRESPRYFTMTLLLHFTLIVGEE